MLSQFSFTNLVRKNHLATDTYAHKVIIILEVSILIRSMVVSHIKRKLVR
jgi:hypothetical protein